MQDASIPIRGWARVERYEHRMLLRVRRLEQLLVTRSMKTITHLGDAGSWIYLGAHYPLDVACGALIGVAAGLLSGWIIGG